MVLGTAGFESEREASEKSFRDRFLNLSVVVLGVVDYFGGF